MSELFDDIVSGLESYKQYKQGKITLKTTTLTKSKPLHITPSEIKSIREMLHLSQAVFAGGEPLSQVWLFWAAPFLGAIVAGFIYKNSLQEKS